MKGYIACGQNKDTKLVFGSIEEARKNGQDIQPCEIISLWVSPSEALPEKDMKIIFMANGITMMGFYYEKEGRIVGVTPSFLKSEYSIQDVSFWMPLPDPPARINEVLGL